MPMPNDSVVALGVALLVVFELFRGLARFARSCPAPAGGPFPIEFRLRHRACRFHPFGATSDPRISSAEATDVATAPTRFAVFLPACARVARKCPESTKFDPESCS